VTTRAERRLLARIESFRDDLDVHFRQRPLLNKSEAADWLGISRGTLDKAIIRGQISTVPFGDSEWIAFADLQRLARVIADEDVS
jgi:hypothetical protein